MEYVVIYEVLELVQLGAIEVCQWQCFQFPRFD